MVYRVVVQSYWNHGCWCHGSGLSVPREDISRSHANFSFVPIPLKKSRDDLGLAFVATDRRRGVEPITRLLGRWLMPLCS